MKNENLWYHFNLGASLFELRPHTSPSARGFALRATTPQDGPTSRSVFYIAIDGSIDAAHCKWMDFYLMMNRIRELHGSCAAASLGLWRSRGVIFQLTRLEIIKSYKGSLLGVFWSFLTPLCMLLVYTFAFSVVLGLRWNDSPNTGHAGFALALFAGLIPFDMFAQSTMSASLSIIGNPHYVKKVIFPTEIIPLVAVCSSLVESLMRLVVLVLWTTLSGVPLFPGVFLAVMVFIPLLFFCAGLSWALAAMGAYFRDLPHGLRVILQLLFFLCPVIYSFSAIPAQYRFWVALNPLGLLISWFSAALLWGHAPNWLLYILMLAACLIVYAVGFAFFLKSKKAIADLI